MNPESGKIICGFVLIEVEFNFGTVLFFFPFSDSMGQWGTLILGSELSNKCFFAFLAITPVLANIFAPNFREMFKWSRQTFCENMKLKYYSREELRTFWYVLVGT